MLEREDRLHSEPSSSEIRSSFQRDRDRILYCAQFRRLGGITQVTTPAELHVFHNRLTHTLEVAQIARRIAERANHQLPVSRQSIDPDVCEAAALAHDLGHPPFGHNGERALDELARDLGHGGAGLPDGYEGNAQSLRILVKLAVRLHDQPGLNLTAATLRASLKYPWKRGCAPSRSDKFGVFESESTEFEAIWQGLPPDEPTIEAQIMDWSDDVAYSTHDLYDFSLAGIIPLSAIKTMSAADLRDSLSDSPAADASDEAYSFISQICKLLPVSPSTKTSRLTSTTVGMLREWVSMLIGRYAADRIEFAMGPFGPKLLKHDSIEGEIAILKALTHQFAIDSPALSVRKEGERRILKTLFEILYESSQSPDKALLSDDNRARIVEEGENPTRVVLDIVSSMTDAQAVSMFHKLTGISPISVLDLTTPSAI